MYLLFFHHYILTQQQNKKTKKIQKKYIISTPKLKELSRENQQKHIRSVINDISIVLNNLSKSIRHRLEKFVNLKLFYL